MRTHPFRCVPLAAARVALSTRLLDAILRGGCALRDAPAAPSTDGGVDAFETLYGSGDAPELEPTPLPQPSLDGLRWNMPSVCSRGRIWLGSTVNEFVFVFNDELRSWDAAELYIMFMS